MDKQRWWCGGDGLGKELKFKLTIQTCEKTKAYKKAYRQCDSHQKDGFVQAKMAFIKMPKLGNN